MKVFYPLQYERTAWHYQQGEDELILKGFKETSIKGPINDAQEIFERVENLFRA